MPASKSLNVDVPFTVDVTDRVSLYAGVRLADICNLAARAAAGGHTDQGRDRDVAGFRQAATPARLCTALHCSRRSTG
ncbi:hypothetical protein [Bradyrhizobium monzae]|uniref:hypothetical protein n=1 Tax=Bradyrhizobium sp. Oc8 TaxID=2876780 RepID=UPI001F437600|nr:hypothetical protein [Bradyrhizobium sp. Oc8]